MSTAAVLKKWMALPTKKIWPELQNQALKKVWKQNDIAFGVVGSLEVTAVYEVFWPVCCALQVASQFGSSSMCLVNAKVSLLPCTLLVFFLVSEFLITLASLSLWQQPHRFFIAAYPNSQEDWPSSLFYVATRQFKPLAYHDVCTVDDVNAYIGGFVQKKIRLLTNGQRSFFTNTLGSGYN